MKPKTALVIVDPQNDFCQGGSLAVPDSNSIFQHINKLRELVQFDKVIITKDMHPICHVSFASTHDKKPFTSIDIDGHKQELWPDHCVKGTKGSEVSTLLTLSGDQIIVEKGSLTDEDSYSGFGTSQNPSKLHSILQASKIQQVLIVGLAFDFCVGSTALDAKSLGYEVYVVQECTRSVATKTHQDMMARLGHYQIATISCQQVLAGMM